MATDRDLIQIVDAAMAEAVRKGGSWIACRTGCTQCCIGAFPITPLDAARLREGLRELDAADPARAQALRARATEYVARLAALSADPEQEALTGDAADEEPCPALDPGTGACDLYGARPLTCRTFGPAVNAGGEGVGICELCFVGASETEIAACMVEVDTSDLERELLAGDDRQTTIAFALLADH